MKGKEAMLVNGMKQRKGEKLVNAMFKPRAFAFKLQVL